MKIKNRKCVQIYSLIYEGTLRKQCLRYQELTKIKSLLCSSVLSFNPIALRKTKIAYNFGLSECNRVNFLPVMFIKQIAHVKI